MGIIIFTPIKLNEKPSISDLLFVLLNVRCYDRKLIHSLGYEVIFDQGSGTLSISSFLSARSFLFQIEGVNNQTSGESIQAMQHFTCTVRINK